MKIERKPYPLTPVPASALPVKPTTAQLAGMVATLMAQGRDEANAFIDKLEAMAAEAKELRGLKDVVPDGIIQIAVRVETDIAAMAQSARAIMARTGS